MSLHAPYIKGHEKRCYGNPVRRACRGCKYWVKNQPCYGKPPEMEDPPKLQFCSNPEQNYAAQWEYIDGHGKVPVAECCQENCAGFLWRGAGDDKSRGD